MTRKGPFGSFSQCADVPLYQVSTLLLSVSIIYIYIYIHIYESISSWCNFGRCPYIKIHELTVTTIRIVSTHMKVFPKIVVPPHHPFSMGFSFINHPSGVPPLMETLSWFISPFNHRYVSIILVGFSTRTGTIFQVPPIVMETVISIMTGWWFGCHEFYFPIRGCIHHPN